MKRNAVQRFFAHLRRHSADDKQVTHPSRRTMLAGMATAPLLGGLGQAEETDADSGPTIQLKKLDLNQLKGKLPKGKIGDLTMSRVIFGNNLIGGWSHARDLIYVSSLFKAYNNDEKVFESLHLAEQAGIDTFNLITDQIPIFHTYVKHTASTMQTIYQCFPHEKDLYTDIDKAIDAGGTTMYVQGGRCDRLINDKRLDVIQKAVEHIQKQGYKAGIGNHTILGPIACEEAGLTPDYYMKTCHHDNYWSAHPRENREEFCLIKRNERDHNKYHDNIFDLFPEKTVEFMETVKKPWIGFKVLAGGAINPKDGFNYAFKNGADFICVGMFDFQIVDDVNVAIDAIAANQDRKRPWYA